MASPTSVNDQITDLVSADEEAATKPEPRTQDEESSVETSEDRSEE
jgi:hypothetical protein